MLTSKHLELRLLKITELAPVHKLHSLPETDEYNTLGIPKSMAETQEIMEGWVANNEVENPKNYTFTIFRKETAEFVGLAALWLINTKFSKAELWYKLHPALWGRGLATEVANTIIDFGFNQLGLHRIEAGCAVDNMGSVRVLEKAGMTLEGRKRKVLPLKQGWTDGFSFAILAEDRKQDTNA